MTEIANTIGSGNIAMPSGYRLVDVSGDTFRRFHPGRKRYERWKKFVDLRDENEKGIVEFLNKNPDGTVIIRSSDTGCMRLVRRQKKS